MPANSNVLSEKIRCVYSTLKQIKDNKVHKRKREPFESFPEEEQITADLFSVLDYAKSQALPWKIISKIWDDKDPILSRYSIPALMCWLFIQDPSTLYREEG